MSKNFHEQYTAAAVAPPSERSTGIVFTVVAVIVAIVWRNIAIVWMAALTVAAILLAASILAPHSLKWLNLAWFRLALVLHKVVNPLVMLALFLVAIVPFGLAMQLVRDPLRKRRRPDARTYWIDRKDVAPPGSMTNQF
jgi:heme/copper-type cytochrome/quinol oxidase subunit 1